MKTQMRHLFSLIFGFFLLLFVQTVSNAQNVKTYIHPRAVELMPTIKKEVTAYMPTLTIPWYFPGLMEHESCNHLRHSKCWNSAAELKNNREQGIGLGQTSRAWDANGRLRFDNLEIFRSRYPKDLWELGWDTFKYRPDLQVRITVIMVRDIEKKFLDVKDDTERMRMVDSAYNGGESHVKRARETCKLTRNCDPKVWFSNVETYLPKSKAADARYGGRSMYEINTNHVKDVFYNRMPKFKPFFVD